MGVDERDYFFGRRSSSAPKKAAALLRISLARRSSRFSRSNSATRSRSARGTPGWVPALYLGVDHPAAQRLTVQTQLLTHGGVPAVTHPSRFTPLAHQANRPIPQLIRIHPWSSHRLHPLHTEWSLRGPRGGSVHLPQGFPGAERYAAARYGAMPGGRQFHQLRVQVTRASSAWPERLGWK
jgi:hypothetical protein